MKKVIFFICIVLTVGQVVNAQPRQRNFTATQQAERVVSKLDHKLTLSGNQKDQLNKIFTASFTRMENIHTSNMNDPAALREALLQNRATTNTEIQNVLTPEQYNTYQKWQEKHMNKKFKCKKVRKDGLQKEKIRQEER